MHSQHIVAFPEEPGRIITVYCTALIKEKQMYDFLLFFYLAVREILAKPSFSLFCRAHSFFFLSEADIRYNKCVSKSLSHPSAEISSVQILSDFWHGRFLRLQWFYPSACGIVWLTFGGFPRSMFCLCSIYCWHNRLTCTLTLDQTQFLVGKLIKMYQKC